MLRASLPSLGGRAIMGNQAIQDMIHSRAGLQPQADPDLCTACGTCVDKCPVSALSMNDAVPVADTELCIMCFCCQEIFPEKAIALR
jgi:ferredoxin